MSRPGERLRGRRRRRCGRSRLRGRRRGPLPAGSAGGLSGSRPVLPPAASWRLRAAATAAMARRRRRGDPRRGPPGPHGPSPPAGSIGRRAPRKPHRPRPRGFRRRRGPFPAPAARFRRPGRSLRSSPGCRSETRRRGDRRRHGRRRGRRPPRRARRRGRRLRAEPAALREDRGRPPALARRAPPQGVRDDRREAGARRASTSCPTPGSAATSASRSWRASWGFSAVVLACGAWRDRPLPVEGADAFVGRGLDLPEPVHHLVQPRGRGGLRRGRASSRRTARSSSAAGSPRSTS